MKNIVIIALMFLACGCGTMRYQLIAEPGQKGRGQIQWDVVEVSFNDTWASLLGVK